MNVTKVWAMKKTIEHNIKYFRLSSTVCVWLLLALWDFIWCKNFAFNTNVGTHRRCQCLCRSRNRYFGTLLKDIFIFLSQCVWFWDPQYVCYALNWPLVALSLQFLQVAVNVPCHSFWPSVEKRNIWLLVIKPMLSQMAWKILMNRILLDIVSACQIKINGVNSRKTFLRRRCYKSSSQF